ncbi:MAG: hypothetical protein JNK90_01040 [Planctomycetaceae bacterium]|nr:hypothetical protein [Planctomycetaceae bacterium]
MGLFERFLGNKKQASQASDDFRQLLEKSMNHLQTLTSSHDSMWGLGSAAWGADLEKGIITFDTDDGTHVEAPLQVIGTYNTQDGTWLWGWDHPSVSEPLSQHAQLAFDYGQKHGIADLTTRKVTCSEDCCWEFTALACFLAQAQGAYRGPAGPTRVFMTFGAVNISKQ